MSDVKAINLTAVFNDICENSATTRADISKRTEISVVTIGKAVEKLESMNFVMQYKNPKIKVGRNENIIELNKNSLFLIIDLSHNNFEYCLINLTGSIIQRDYYFHNPDFIYEDNLRAFFNSIYKKIDNYKSYTILCIGVLLPSVLLDSKIFKSSELHYIDIEKILRESLRFENCISEYFLSCASDNIKNEFTILPNDTYVYFSMMPDYPSISVCNTTPEKIICFGDIPVSPKLNYSQILKMTLSTESLIRYIVTALSAVASITGAKVILIDDNNYTFTNAEISNMEKEVCKRIKADIKLTLFNKKFAIQGITKIIKSKILLSEAKGNSP